MDCSTGRERNNHDDPVYRRQLCNESNHDHCSSTSQDNKGTNNKEKGTNNNSWVKSANNNKTIAVTIITT